MATRSRTPSRDPYNSHMPNHSDAANLNRDYRPATGSRPNSYIANTSIAPTDFQVRAAPVDDAPHNGPQFRFHETFSSMEGDSTGDQPRADSQASTSHPTIPIRNGTLKKKASLSKKVSLRRGGSRKSSRVGSVRSMNLGEKERYGVGQDELNSAFSVPIPTSGNPTDILANRFQAWRKVLKDLVAVFRDIQRSYETRSKMLLSASNAMNNIVMPPNFLISGGISDATNILKDYHRQALQESNKAKEVETEIVLQLNGLRNDLQQKIKEIKGLSGDFKNSVDKEVEGTRKAVRNLHESLGLVDSDPSATSGKGDPFVIRMSVEKQLEKQLEEENYLHRAYLNLENSGRDLESIVIGEIQKAYNAYASVLKRDADTAYNAVERLRDGPVSMPKDQEWNAFVAQSEHLIDPNLDLRDFENITYPGKDHPAAAEVRAGMLERKSKYLKSYTAGWYVLSPTHLHEFRSADRIAAQSPVMSLYLPEQKLGTHSQPESSSHKFMLKGRQTGPMHRGHAWVFRAETHETMLAWYDDIKNLTEMTGEVRNAFVRKHARSMSGVSYRTSSISSDGVMEEDEADRTPYSADQVMHNQASQITDDQWQQRPQPGGRFPSDVQIQRLPLSLSSGTSSEPRDGASTFNNVSANPHDEHQPPQSMGKEENNISDSGVHFTDGPSVDRPVLEKRHSSNYGYWIQPRGRSTSPSYQQNNLNHTAQSPSPQPDEGQQRVQTIASSSGAPVIVPWDTMSGSTGERNAPYQPPNNDPRTDQSTSLVGIGNGAEHPYDGASNMSTESRPLSPPESPKFSRTSTLELKVPGQYPTTKNG